MVRHTDTPAALPQEWIVARANLERIRLRVDRENEMRCRQLLAAEGWTIASDQPERVSRGSTGYQIIVAERALP
jgi:hypothetical protein